MVLVVQADMPLYIKSLARPRAADSVFDRVIAATSQQMAYGGQPAVKVFLAQFGLIARPLGRTLGMYFDARTLDAPAAGGDTALIAGLQAKADSVIPVTMRTLKGRLELAGVFLGKMTRRGADQLELQIAGKDKAGLHSLFTVQGNLQFTLVRDDTSAADLLRRLDSALTRPAGSRAKETASGITPTDSARAAVYRAQHPLSSQCLMMVQTAPGSRPQYVDMTAAALPVGQYSFNVLYRKAPDIMNVLAYPDVRAVIPADVQIALGIPTSEMIPGSGDSDGGNRLCPLYVLNATPELSGGFIAGAESADQSKNGQWAVNITMTSQGAALWEKVTDRNPNRRVAIVADNRVYSAPQIMGKMSGGKLQVTLGNGPDAQQAAALLAVALKMGGLPAPLKIVEEHLIAEPTA